MTAPLNILEIPWIWPKNWLSIYKRRQMIAVLSKFRAHSVTDSGTQMSFVWDLEIWMCQVTVWERLEVNPQELQYVE